MEGLEATITQTPPAPTPVAAPAPTPVAAPATPAPIAAAPIETSSGGSSSSIKEVFQSLNWVEICFGILGSAALYSVIYYHRYMVGQHKSQYNALANQIDDMNIKLSDMDSAMSRDMIQAGFDGQW